jgi:DNA-binding transcriptional ArsR family regulator
VAFTPVPHAPTRLSIVSLLAATTRAEFGFVRDSLRLSDSALSKQISIVEQAGYVTVNKTGAGRRSRTHVRLSPGRDAFDGHVAALQKLVNVSAPDVSAPDVSAPDEEPAP